MTDMQYRTLGKTGLEISEVGYGAWGIGQAGWLGAEDRESLRALDRAIGLGVNFIDTALGYGDGHSEELVGQAVRAGSSTVYVATKVPPKHESWPPGPEVDADDAFPADWIRSCTEQSLSNLGLETIDLLQFHVWQDQWLDSGEWWQTIEALKTEGKVRFFGVSIVDHDPGSALKLAGSGRVDALQVIYNVFEQSPEDDLFGVAAEHEVGVIARVPFDEGGLTGRIDEGTEFPEGDWRNMYFRGDRRREVGVRARAIADDLGIGVDELAEAALRFVLSSAAVTTAIPGMRSMRNVERNCAAADGKGLSPERIAALRPHRWLRNWYDEDDA